MTREHEASHARTLPRRPRAEPTAGARAWTRVYRWRIVATVHTGVTRVGYFLIWVIPSGATTLAIDNDDRAVILWLVGGYAVVGGVVARAAGRRAFEPVARWLDSDREPTPEEQESLLVQPRTQAIGVFTYWLVGGVIAGANYLAFFDPDPLAAMLVFAGVAFLGSHAAAFSYLLVERALRPTAARAMGGSQPTRLTILSVKNRFLMAFAFGPGITIAGIAIFLTVRGPAGIDLAPAVWPVVVLGLIDGYLLVALAAASVTEPMEQVRLAMKRVLDGDLNADVPVDAGSEVGLLQVGLNRMLAGLRERELLRQLLGRSTGADVAERLVSHGVDFKGTEMQASVLMVDMIGSTPLTESDAADVLATLNSLFAAVVDTTTSYGGWVNRFVGDAALCVFGTPVPVDDHATRALAAARALQEELLALRRDRPWLDVGVGVSSGPLIAANVGTASRFEFAVIGDAANEAARLTDIAKGAPARLVASGAALDAASEEEAAFWVVADEVLLRGKSRTTTVYEPLATLAAEVDNGLPANVD